MPRVSLPGGAGLAAEAAREPGVAHAAPRRGSRPRAATRARPRWSRRGRGRRLGQVVDLLLGVGQEAGAVERLLADEHRRDDRLEAVAAQLVQRPLDQRELQQDEVAAQVGEARAAEPRAALHVDPLAGQLEVVAGRGEGGPVADLADDGVLGRRVGVGQVGQQRRAPPAASASTLAQLGVERLGAGRDLLHLRDRLAGVLAGLLGARRSRPTRRSGARAGPRARAGSRGGGRRARGPRPRAAAASPPRRASAARTRSGSRRISLTSSTAARR